MTKRVLLFLLTNLAILITFSIAITLLSRIFGIPIGGGSMVGLLAFCLLWGMGVSFVSLQLSRWMAKRAMGVRLIDGKTGNGDLDWVFQKVDEIRRRAGLPMPEVGVYNSPEVNAFATGPSSNRALVAVSTGLLSNMRRDEVEGVLGHEIAHIQNGDMVTMALVQGVINAFVMFFARIVAGVISNALASRSGDGEGAAGLSWFAHMMVVMVLEIVFGVLGSLVTAGFSRHREFRADSGAVDLVGREQMVAALRRLRQTRDAVETHQPAYASMKIANVPGFIAWFSTHPPIEKRIAALEGR